MALSSQSRGSRGRSLIVNDFNKTAAPKVSIVLLTRNSAKTIKGVLDGIVKQEYHDYEILLIDSSSEDDTLKIAHEYPCRVVIIKPEDFGHGKTRNYAASLAKGEFIVFLTHDSTPRKSDWLTEMLKPFQDKNIVGVYGRQIPRKNEKVLDMHFQMSLYGSKKIIWGSNNWRQGDNVFSDANSAVRKKVILTHPYSNDIIVSEDYEWATRVLRLGFSIVYIPSASVIHSHSYNIYTLFKRNFDVGVSYRDVYTSKNNYAFTVKGLQIAKQEIAYLRQSGHTILIPLAVFRNLIRFIAIQLGKYEYLFTKEFKSNHLSAQKWYWK
jgi:glycosyltransferase involved in cell wall biosynthesis